MPLSLKALSSELASAESIEVPGDAGTFTVGRDEDNDLCIDHSSISGFHARLEFSGPGEVDLVDCDSSNGTFVNGEKVERRSLREGDVVRFANLEFRVILDTKAPVSETKPVPLPPEDGASYASTEIRDLHQEVEKLKLELGDARGEAATADRELGRAKAKIGELTRELRGAGELTREREKQIGKLEGEAARSEETVRGKAEEIASLVEEQNRIVRESGEREAGLAAERDRLHETILERDRQIEGLGEEVSRRDEIIREKEQDLASLVKEHAATVHGKDGVIAALESEIEALRNAIAERDARIESLEGDVAERVGTIGEQEARIEALLQEHSSALDRKDEEMAALRKEHASALTGKDGEIAVLLQEHAWALDGKQREITALTADRDSWQSAHGEKEEVLAEREEELARRTESENEALRRTEHFLAAIRDLGTKLRNDWMVWAPGELGGDLDEDSEVALLARVEAIREVIRGQLDLIEPIWGEFGEGVQQELRSRCEALRGELAELDETIALRKEQLAEADANLSELREVIDTEVRRAQGLSRRGMQVEIPERFESMVIPRDREQEIYRALVERIEFFDRLLEGYRKSKKLHEVTRELTEFRDKLARVLETNGVREFDCPIGTELTLKNRREVRILGRKGWGTREFIEQPYQPGRVLKVVESGYRVGEGEQAVVLRKVAVLIRDAAG